MGSADDLRNRAEQAWQTFRAAVAAVDLDAPTTAGWSAKEMLAHVAFWLETVPAYVGGAFRGDHSAFDIVFPSGYAAEMDWPPFEVHNAREAAWGRIQPGSAVLERVDTAHAQLTTFLHSVTDDEATAHADYFAGVTDHLDEHRAELAG